jgi:RHS repeat-associated protein
VGGQVDSFDLATSNVLVQIPVRSKLGKTPFAYELVGNSGAWIWVSGQVVDWATSSYKNGTSFNESESFLLFGTPLGNLGSVSYAPTESNMDCNGDIQDVILSGFGVVDALGTVHPIPSSIKVDQDGCIANQATAMTVDGSGYTMQITLTKQVYTVAIYDRSGNQLMMHSNGLGYTLTDPDLVTESYSWVDVQNVSLTTTFTDTLGDTALTNTITDSPYGNASTYLGGDGNANDGATIQYTSGYHLKSVFNCSGISDFDTSSAALATGISFTDGSKISITYETTPGYSYPYTTGRIASITYRDGGSVTYQYSGGNNGINCNSQVVPTMTRTVNDNNGHLSKWTYVNSNSSSTPGVFTVTETDPALNNTVYTFSGGFQTEKQVYQGTVSPSHLVSTQITCYNNNFTNCPTAAPPYNPSNPSPITQTDVYSYPTNSTSPSLVETKFNSSGTVAEVKQYDFGAAVPPSGGPGPIFDSLVYYGQSWNSSSNSCNAYPSGTYIYDTPCYIYTKNSSGGQAATTQITYSNTGHPTSTSRWTGGSSPVTSSATYNSNGTVQTVTGASGGLYTYAYNGTNGCASLLPTSVTVTGTNLPSAGLTSSTQWDCNGGVPTQTTDPNQQPTTYAYNDPFWRLTSVTDPLGYVTTTTYTVETSSNPASQQTYMNFPTANPTSTVDVLTTFDGLGRVLETQRGTAPGTNGATSFDQAIQYTYGWTTTGSVTGAFMTQTVPGGTALTTTQLDALGRVVSVVDGGGGTTTNTYNQNDVVSALSPAPANENNKQTQNEYDGLGRLTSSCKISSLVSGNVGCNQKTGTSNGVLTSTTYTPATGSQTVKSTRGSQYRTTTLDALGRTTQVVTPESNYGSWNYYYDSAAHGICPGHVSSNGNLICATDPNGNVLNYFYDALNRLTEVNANGTTCRWFYYDSSSGYTGTIPSGISTPTNSSGRMVEAATDACVSPNSHTTSTIITDEWFSYDQDGNMTDTWELTPNSGQYYHATATFAGNGAALTLKLDNITPAETSTYKLDGEGRWNSLNTYGQTIVPSNGTTFNAAGQPTVIDIGTGADNDTYTYDPNTGRMKTWVFTVGTKNESGMLNWNSNWTLNNVAITDGFNSGGTQTCYFNPSSGSGMGYDDLGRLLNDNCGSVWAQTFGYDQYDNVWKNGSISWACATCYNTSTNQYNSGVGTESYDSNGDLTSDPYNTYAWNEYGKLKSANINGTNCAMSGQCLVYDAFGRAVEIDSGGSSTEIWYTQLGKTAYMNGATFNYAYWPTPGGATLLQTHGYSYYFQHTDWLGSARISSNLGTVIIDDRAFAPYGELYNNFGSTNANENIFTGDTQDILGTLDCCFDTPNREMSSTQGRWLSPDPARAGWNQYAYVSNMPNNSVDPLGLYCPVLPTNYNGPPINCNPDAPGPLGEGLAGPTGDFPLDLGGGGNSWFGNGIFSGDEVPLQSLSQQLAALLGSIFPCQTEFGASCNPIGPMGYHTNDQNYIVGDYNGEIVCPTGTSICTMWNALTNMWEQYQGDPTLDNRANALAQAVNNTGVQALQNPCTIGGFYLGSAALGAAGVFGPSAVMWAADNPLVIGHWLLGRMMSGGFGKPSLGVMITGAILSAKAAYSACYD